MWTCSSQESGRGLTVMVVMLIKKICCFLQPDILYLGDVTELNGVASTKKWRHFSEWAFKKPPQLHLASYSCLYLYNQTHTMYLIASLILTNTQKGDQNNECYSFFKPLIIFSLLQKNFFNLSFLILITYLRDFFSPLFALPTCTLSTSFRCSCWQVFPITKFRRTH